MKIAFLAISSLFFCISLGAKEIPQTSTKEAFYLPDTTSLAVKIDTESLQEVDFIKKLLFKKGSKVTELHSKILTFFKFDLFKVQTTWFATGAKDEYLFIFKGGFDSLLTEKKLRMISPQSTPQYDAINFAVTLPDEQKKDVYNIVAILDKDTIIFGEENFTKKYLNVLSKKNKGLSTSQLKLISDISQSPKLIHGTTLNFELPENEKNNPVLKSLKQGEFSGELNAMYFKIKLAATVHNNKNLAGLSLLLNGLVNMQKQAKKKTGDQLIDELIYNSKIVSLNNQLKLDSKIKQHNLELFINKKVLGENAAF
jgi:hypothetical protein